MIYLKKKGGIHLQEYMKRYAKGSIILSICFVILSLFLIFKPDTSLNVVFIFLGIFLVILGIIHTVSYFSSTKETKTFSFELIEGLICIILGMVIVFNPSMIKAFLPIMVGCWIITNSVLKIQFGFNLKSADNPSWKIILISSILNLIFGIVMVFNPFATMAALTIICGIMLLVSELINIFESITMIRFLK